MKKIITLLIVSFMTINWASYAQSCPYQLWVDSFGETSITDIPSLVGIEEACEGLTKSGFLTAVVHCDEEIYIILNQSNDAEEMLIDSSLVGEERYLKRFHSISIENLTHQAQQALIDKNLKAFFESLNISYSIKDKKIVVSSSDNYQSLQECLYPEI